MSFLMFYCLKVLISAIFEKRVTDRRTHGRTDGPTDKASYRDAWTHLKTLTNTDVSTQSEYVYVHPSYQRSSVHVTQ